MEHKNEKQHWNTAMTHNNEKQQSYNNETIEWKTTIVQQLYNNRSTMKTNETNQWNMKIKHNNKKQHCNTAMKHSNEKEQSYYNEKTIKHKNVKTIVQQWYYNRSTMKNQ